MALDSLVWDYFPPEKSKHASASQRRQPLAVYFRVEFYVENVNLLALESTRHLYYIQVLKRMRQ